MWDERRIRMLAAGQHGLVRRADLIAQGVTDREIGLRVGSARLDPHHAGVYYLDSVPATWKTAVLGAVMAAGPQALASHRCAAALWELDAIRGRVVEITVPYVDSPEPVGVLLHRTRRSNPSAIVDSIPLTTPERTILDLASLLPGRTLEKATRSAVHKGLTTEERLDQAIGKFGGRGVSGTKKLRSVLANLAGDQSGSVSEIDLRQLIDDSAIPRPVQQLKIGLPDGRNAYPDFSWPDRMRIVEVDGFQAHGTPTQLQADLRRQNSLMELGWEFRRFTASEIRDDPMRVREEITRFVNQAIL